MVKLFKPLIIRLLRLVTGLDLQLLDRVRKIQNRHSFIPGMAKLKPASLFLRLLDLFSVFCRPNFSLICPYFLKRIIKMTLIWNTKKFLASQIFKMFLIERPVRPLVKINFSILPKGKKVWPPMIYTIPVTFNITKKFNR